jgi:hypothetical protein
MKPSKQQWQHTPPLDLRMFVGNQDFFSWPIVEALPLQLQLANLPPQVPTYSLSENSDEEKLRQPLGQQVAQPEITEKHYEIKFLCKINTIKFVISSPE